MAIDVAAINPFSPAFLRLTPSILDAARPQIEPVGYNSDTVSLGRRIRWSGMPRRALLICAPSRRARRSLRTNRRA